MKQNWLEGQTPPKPIKGLIGDFMDDDELAVQQSKCYAVVRGQRDRARSLELRWLDGRTLAIDWAWMPDVVWSAPGHITLLFSSRGFRVTITGRNLGQLRNMLGMRTVVWVQQMLIEHDKGSPEAECVFGITVAPLGEGEELQWLAPAQSSST